MLWDFFLTKRKSAPFGTFKNHHGEPIKVMASNFRDDDSSPLQRLNDLQLVDKKVTD